MKFWSFVIPLGICLAFVMNQRGYTKENFVAITALWTVAWVIAWAIYTRITKGEKK